MIDLKRMGAGRRLLSQVTLLSSSKVKHLTQQQQLDTSTSRKSANRNPKPKSGHPKS